MLRKACVYGLIAILLILPVFAESRAYVIDLAYFDGKLTLLRSQLGAGYSGPGGNESMPYEFRLYSQDNEILYRDYFSIPKNEPTAFTISIPHNPSGKTVAILEKGRGALSIDVTPLATYCGDNACQDNENYATCQQDCASGGADGYCDGLYEGICDPDCSYDKDTDCAPPLEAPAMIENEKSFNPLFVAIPAAIIAVIAIIIGLFYWKRDSLELKFPILRKLPGRKRFEPEESKPEERLAEPETEPVAAKEAEQPGEAARQEGPAESAPTAADTVLSKEPETSEPARAAKPAEPAESNYSESQFLPATLDKPATKALVTVPEKTVTVTKETKPDNSAKSETEPAKPAAVPAEKPQPTAVKPAQKKPITRKKAKKPSRKSGKAKSRKAKELRKPAKKQAKRARK